MPAWKALAMTALMMVCLAGCSLRGKKSVSAAPPPPPAPTVAKVPEGPLSIPQTSVQLPPPQPLDPKALETARQEPAPEPEPAPPPKPPRRAAQPSVATGPQLPPVETAPVAPPEERPRLQEIVPPEEKRRLAEEIAVRKREIQDVLHQASRRRLSEQDRGVVERIRSFVQLSDQAAARDDIRQAEALTERALVLARELRGAR